MSPDGGMFAVAYTKGRLELRHAEDGNVLKTVGCKPHQDHHRVVWMYFLNESSIIAEYQCGNVYKHCLPDPSVVPNDADITLSFPPTHSGSNILSCCSLDRSTILRFTQVQNSGVGDNKARGGVDELGSGPYHQPIKKGHDGLVVLDPGEWVYIHLLDCRSWETRLLALPPSLKVSERYLLDPRSLAISRDNQYVGLVLVEAGGSCHDARRRTHVWSTKDGNHIVSRDARGPKWESWIPANHFDNFGKDHRFILRQRDDSSREELDFIVMYIIAMIPACMKLIDHMSHYQITGYTL